MRCLCIAQHLTDQRTAAQARGQQQTGGKRRGLAKNGVELCHSTQKCIREASAPRRSCCGPHMTALRKKCLADGIETSIRAWQLCGLASQWHANQNGTHSLRNHSGGLTCARSCRMTVVVCTLLRFRGVSGAAPHHLAFRARLAVAVFDVPRTLFECTGTSVAHARATVFLVRQGVHCLCCCCVGVLPLRVCQEHPRHGALAGATQRVATQRQPGRCRQLVARRASGQGVEAFAEPVGFAPPVCSPCSRQQPREVRTGLSKSAACAVK